MKNINIHFVYRIIMLDYKIDKQNTILLYKKNRNLFLIKTRLEYYKSLNQKELNFYNMILNIKIKDYKLYKTITKNQNSFIKFYNLSVLI